VAVAAQVLRAFRGLHFDKLGSLLFPFRVSISTPQDLLYITN